MAGTAQRAQRSNGGQPLSGPLSVTVSAKAHRIGDTGSETSCNNKKHPRNTYPLFSPYDFIEAMRESRRVFRTVLAQRSAATKRV
jgi:hypothetical protein